VWERSEPCVHQGEGKAKGREKKKSGDGARKAGKRGWTNQKRATDEVTPKETGGARAPPSDESKSQKGKSRRTKNKGGGKGEKKEKGPV